VTAAQHPDVNAKQQQCWNNAYWAVLVKGVLPSGSLYVEGFALAPNGNEFPHAWCETPDGAIVDPTLVLPMVPVSGDGRYRPISARQALRRKLPFRSEDLATTIYLLLERYTRAAIIQRGPSSPRPYTDKLAVIAGLWVGIGAQDALVLQDLRDLIRAARAGFAVASPVDDKQVYPAPQPALRPTACTRLWQTERL
jgi:hypothetical protein